LEVKIGDTELLVRIYSLFSSQDMKENSEFLLEHGITHIFKRENNMNINYHSYNRFLQFHTLF
jgi:hypothetical protein